MNVLRAECRPGPPGTTVLALHGDADLHTAWVLAEGLRQALTGPPAPSTLIVDCAGLRFCAAAGLNALLHARHTATDAGIGFRLIAPAPQLVRILAVTDTATTLGLPDTGPATHPV
ncbi:STAS domain-containing protein [Streptomyces sp. NPDC097619]|uniref:STAS domain-containing protein n=1 Tax=Streptomyces sp. NPDC097619 TaxID=3157228 RepID=UPI003321E60A